jgi:hypothetical protein
MISAPTTTPVSIPHDEAAPQQIDDAQRIEEGVHGCPDPHVIDEFDE